MTSLTDLSPRVTGKGKGKGTRQTGEKVLLRSSQEKENFSQKKRAGRPEKKTVTLRN